MQTPSDLNYKFLILHYSFRRYHHTRKYLIYSDLTTWLGSRPMSSNAVHAQWPQTLVRQEHGEDAILSGRATGSEGRAADSFLYLLFSSILQPPPPAVYLPVVLIYSHHGVCLEGKCLSRGKLWVEEGFSIGLWLTHFLLKTTPAQSATHFTDFWQRRASTEHSG